MVPARSIPMAVVRAAGMSIGIGLSVLLLSFDPRLALITGPTVAVVLEIGVAVAACFGVGRRPSACDVDVRGPFDRWFDPFWDVLFVLALPAIVLIWSERDPRAVIAMVLGIKCLDLVAVLVTRWERRRSAASARG